jgi:hypothetical protein
MTYFRRSGFVYLPHRRVLRVGVGVFHRRVEEVEAVFRR